MPQLDFNIWLINGIYFLFFFFIIYAISFRYIIYPLGKLFYTRVFFIERMKVKCYFYELEYKYVVIKNLLSFEVVEIFEHLKQISEKLLDLNFYLFNYYLLYSFKLSFLKNSFFVKLLNKKLFGLIKIKVINAIL